MNHPVKAVLSEDKKNAVIKLRDTVDRSLVPCRDFVLLLRDESMTEPSIISAPTPSGRQAVSLKFVPDMRSIAVK